MFARSYTVHLPPDVSIASEGAVYNLKLVKDGLTWGALLFPAIWALFNRMWLPFLGYLVFALVIELALVVLGASDDGLLLSLGLINLFFALEAGALLRWSLQRKGWQTVYVVTGRTYSDCEAKAVALLIGNPSEPAPIPEPHPNRMPGSRGNGDRARDDVIGLFPAPES